MQNYKVYYVNCLALKWIILKKSPDFRINNGRIITKQLYLHSLNRSTKHCTCALPCSKVNSHFLDLLISRSRNKNVSQDNSFGSQAITRYWACIYYDVSKPDHSWTKVAYVKLWFRETQFISISTQTSWLTYPCKSVRVTGVMFMSDRQGNYLDMTNTTGSPNVSMFIFIHSKLIYCSGLLHNV